MSDRTVRVSDDAVRRGIARRAPGHADRALLDGIMLEVGTTGQVGGIARRLPRPALPRRTSWALLAAAVLLVLAVLAAVLVAGGSTRMPEQLAESPGPSLAAAPALLASPSSGPDAAPTPSSPTCTPGGGIELLTGGAMPPAVTSPATLDPRVEAGVYTTVHGESTSLRFDVWAAQRGGTSRRIAVAGAASGLVVEDVTPDGSIAIVSVRRGLAPGLECDDLYALATDGSMVERLVDSAIGWRGIDARISPDGRWLAYSESAGPATASVTIFMRELRSPGGAGAAASTDCGQAWNGEMLWSPTGDQLAAVCGTEMIVVGTGGGSRRYELPSADAVQAFAWSSPSELLVAMTPVVNSPAPVVVWALDTTRGSVSPRAFARRWVSTPPVTLVQSTEASPMSAIGHEFLAHVEVDASGVFPWHVVNFETGASRQIDDGYARDVELQPGGSTAAGEASVVRGVELDAIDLATLRTTALGTLPVTYEQGRWRLH